MIRIAVVDDHTLVREGICKLVNSLGGFEVVLEAEHGEEFLELLPHTPVDVVLLDLMMPVMDGYETCMQVVNSYPDIKVMILSQFYSKESVSKIIELGAHGYLSKCCTALLLKQSINSIYDEGFYLDKKIKECIKDAFGSDAYLGNEASSIQLTERELEIVNCVIHQMSSAEIGEKLCISKFTVENHRTNMIKKTNSKNFVGVLLHAFKHEMPKLREYEANYVKKNNNNLLN